MSERNGSFFKALLIYHLLTDPKDEAKRGEFVHNQAGVTLAFLAFFVMAVVGMCIGGLEFLGIYVIKDPLPPGAYVSVDGVLSMSGQPLLRSFKHLQIPNGIREVRCRGCNRLVSLDGLPCNVQKIDCSFCSLLASLEGLPDSVTEIVCKDCPRLTNLRKLPSKLQKIDCSQCKNLISLDGLPHGIIEVNCSGCTELTSLAGLPNTVKVVYCKDCPKLTGMDKLPSHVKVIR